MSEIDETPWAMVVRMRAAKAPFDEIVLALKNRGLSREDIELLLADAPELKASAALPPSRERPASTPPPTEPEVELTAIGGPLRWAGIFFGLAGVVLGSRAASRGELWGWVLSAGGVAAAVMLLRSELSSGLHRTLRKLGAVLFFVCFLPMLSNFISGVNAWSIGGALGFLLALPMFILAPRLGEKIKGIADVGAFGDIFESNGVQFSVLTPDRPELAQGESSAVLIVAQNCVAAPRELLVQFGGETRALMGELRRVFPLEPGKIVSLTVPVRIGALAGRVVDVVVGVSAVGAQAGPRLRIATGAEWTTPAESLTTNVLGAVALAAVGVGTFSLGSNGAFRLRCDENKPMVQDAREPEIKELYAPAPEQLAAAAKS